MEIAVLLGDRPGDRYAVLHAIALAKRAGETVHGIRQEPAPPRLSPGHAAPEHCGQTLLLHLADLAGVAVRCHALEGRDITGLRALLREQRINCLIVGAGDETERQRAEKRLESLRRSLPTDRQWSIRPFWALVTGPWSDEALAAALAEYPDLHLPSVSKRC